MLWLIPTFCVFSVLGMSGCALFAPRPVQEMSFTAAAIRAAKEVQADTLAPELFRQSNEWFFKAKHEYKFKNFKLAREYSNKARYFAEQAEFESLRNGGIRSEQGGGPDPLTKDPLGGAPPPPPDSGSSPNPNSTPYPYPTPTGTPASAYDQRKAAEDQAAKQEESQPQQQQPDSSQGIPSVPSVGSSPK